MDDTQRDPRVDEPIERSAEEVAWDQEFGEPKKNDVMSVVGELAALAVKVPVTIISMPLQLIPQETRRHSRAAVRESFLAVRSLLGAVGDGIESILADPEERAAAPGGPDGTWGSRRQQMPTMRRETPGMDPDLGAEGVGLGVHDPESAAGGGRARHIEIDDDAGVDTPVPMREQSEEAISTQVAEEAEETGEGRGLRSDIEY